MDKQAICQSCAMPLQKSEDYGKNADGSPNGDYCQYCYADGKFTSETTMDEMIGICVPHCIEAGVYKTPEEARAAMGHYFPSLKRWKTV